jgi:isopenicillin-N epimerase
MTDHSSLTRRDLLTAGTGFAAAAALPSASAQSLPNMPSSSRELWQWVRTQPMLDLQLATSR